MDGDRRNLFVHVWTPRCVEPLTRDWGESAPIRIFAVAVWGCISISCKEVKATKGYDTHTKAALGSTISLSLRSSDISLPVSYSISHARSLSKSVPLHRTTDFIGINLSSYCVL